MSVIVTGGSGMVGHALQELKPEWIYLSSKDVDLRNYNETLNYFQNTRPKIIIHLAANVGGLFKNMEHQSDMFYDNLMMNMNIVKICELFDIYLICCLSTCIFPDYIEYPIYESQIHDGEPHLSNFGYAYSKRMMDVMCRISLKSKYTCIIPCNIYGHYDNFNLKNAHVIPALIHKAYIAKKNNDKLRIHGTGTPLRQFVFAPDVARICVALIDMNIPVKRLIIAPSEEIDIGSVAKFIAKTYNVDYEFDNDIKKDGQERKTCDNSFLSRILPHFKFTPFEFGLKYTIDWFTKNYDIARK